AGRFVRLQLEDRLIGAHELAVLLEPARQRAFGDRLADGRHFDVNGHAALPRWRFGLVTRPGWGTVSRPCPNPSHAPPPRWRFCGLTNRGHTGSVSAFFGSCSRGSDSSAFR